MKTLAILASVLIIGIPCSILDAKEVRIAPSGDEKAWLPVTFPKVEKDTKYEIRVGSDERPEIHAISECSASALVALGERDRPRPNALSPMELADRHPDAKPGGAIEEGR